jgi:hypothetical protein
VLCIVIKDQLLDFNECLEFCGRASLDGIEASQNTIHVAKFIVAAALRGTVHSQLRLHLLANKAND